MPPHPIPAQLTLFTSRTPPRRNSAAGASSSQRGDSAEAAPAARPQSIPAPVRPVAPLSQLAAPPSPVSSDSAPQGAFVDLLPLIQQQLERSAREMSPAAAYLEQLGPGSRKTIRESLAALVAIAMGFKRTSPSPKRGQSTRALLDIDRFPWGHLRYAHTLMMREQLIGDGYAPKTINRTLTALRGTLREAIRLGLTDNIGECTRAMLVKGVPGGRLRRPRLINAAEWTALFGSCDDSTRGRRNAAFLTLLRQGGLREWEAAGVDVTDYDPATGALFVARGKGAKCRTVWISHEGKDAMAAWLTLRGNAPGPLLCPVSQLGHVQLRRPTTSALRYWWHSTAAAAGVTATWPHCARATAITEIAERAGVHVAQQYAGHARLDQTGEYIQLDAERLRAASELLRVPPVR